MSQFKWNEVPSDDKGFVDYYLIPSMDVRLMIARAEKIKLEHELNARQQWTPRLGRAARNCFQNGILNAR